MPEIDPNTPRCESVCGMVRCGLEAGHGGLHQSVRQWSDVEADPPDPRFPSDSDGKGGSQTRLIIEKLRETPTPLTSGWNAAADFIEREFGGESDA